MGSKKGQESILCDGPCKSWIHRRCAGMSKAAFSSISKSTDPFFCPLCKLSKNELEVKLLKDKVSLLESKLQSALSQLESATWYSRPATHSEASSLSDTAPSPGPQGSQFHGDTASRSDQRCNVVIYGLQECRQGSSRQDRWEEDLKDIVSTLSSVADTIDASSVKDHFRLGKYKLDSRRPRPILVKMIRANDVNKILSEASSLEKPLMIKPGLSRSQQRREALLLKERWKLLEQGVDRKAIKLRGYTSIYINNVKHGSLNNDNRYVLTTPSTSGEAVVHSPENHGVGDHSSQDQEDHLTQVCSVANFGNFKQVSNLASIKKFPILVQCFQSIE